MIKNFFLLSLRNFQKNKFFVVINVLGLGIALACCIVAFYNNQFHYNFDSIHSKKDIIYKVGMHRIMPDRHQAYGITPLSLKPAAEESLNGATHITRYVENSFPIRFSEHIMNKDIGFVDKNFLDVFDFEILRGDRNAIKDKKTLLITEKCAKSFFGNDDPIGRILTFYIGEQELVISVGGIIKDLPENSTMTFDGLSLIDNYIDINKFEEFSWRGWVAATFLVVPDERNLAAIEKKLGEYVALLNDVRDDFQINDFYLEALKDLPSTGRDTWSYWLTAGLHPAALVAPSIMAVLILLLACLNFTNTALAISNRRLKEIGVRKVFGGIRIQAVFQFIGENFILVFIALLFSLLIGVYLLSAYSNMWPGMTLQLEWSGNIKFWLFLIGLLIVTSLISASYPAFYVNRFNPVNILKGDIKFKGAGIFSKILLVIQFVLAVTGIISAVLFLQNARYQDEIYLGYNKDQVIAIPIEENSKLNLFKNQISLNPHIKSIGVSEEHINYGSYNRTLKWGTEQQEVSGYDIGQGYFTTMGLQLIDGRSFDEELRESERDNAIIINEELANSFGWENPIGQRLRENDTIVLTVVGVMKNFYPWGFWAKISPTMMKFGVKDRMRMITVQTDIDEIHRMQDYLKTEWEKIIPNEPYPGFYQSEALAESKDINEQIVKIFLFLGIVSIVLSLVGLYTLVSLTIIKKMKEIGIRKVIGAPVWNIVRLINRDFFLIVLIASLIGSVVGYFLTDILMGSVWVNYVSASIWSFIIPVVLIIFVSVLTLAIKVYYAATKNPIDAIRYE